MSSREMARTMRGQNARGAAPPNPLHGNCVGKRLNVCVWMRVCVLTPARFGRVSITMKGEEEGSLASKIKADLMRG